jgi:pathogenesis-related protein 1
VRALLGAALLAAAPVHAQNEMQTMLDAHNAVRARHCAPPMSWSPALAASAQQWANRCVFNHDRNNPYGENLAWGTRLSAREAFGLWYEEISQYNWRAPGFGPAGHFTQVIWRDSRQLGCAAARCGDEVYWVCRYAPAGNVGNEYQANVLPICR